MACYDKEGKPKMMMGSAPEYLIIHNAFKPKAERKQVSITADGFKVCDPTGKLRAVIAKQAIDVDASAIIASVEQAYRMAGKIHVKEAVIDSVKITDSDDHIRQLIREEMRQFVTRELMPGGLLSK
ncbi:hypothetical protein [Xenorhabdus mauleonii]|nr:hypothetical protein [Xenorhabdus mauleonii]